MSKMSTPSFFVQSNKCNITTFYPTGASFREVGKQVLILIFMKIQCRAKAIQNVSVWAFSDQNIDITNFLKSKRENLSLCYPLGTFSGGLERWKKAFSKICFPYKSYKCVFSLLAPLIWEKTNLPSFQKAAFYAIF